MRLATSFIILCTAGAGLLATGIEELLRRVGLAVMNRPLDEVDELLALGRVGLRFVNEQIRE